MTEFVSPVGSPIQDQVFHLPPEQRKQNYNILLLEGIDQLAVDRLKDEGYMVESLKATLDPQELKEKIKTVHAIGIRSRTHLTEDILLEARNLLCIGTFCIGTNQVDLKAAERLGIPVFNSPFSNSRSVAELTIGQIIALSRRLGEKNLEMHRGTWNKSAKGCYEIRGKTLGIVGYGHIGSQLSVLAESMGMNVIYYDINPVMPLGNSTTMSSLDGLLKKADFVTLHVPETPLTKNMITKQQLRLMRKGSYLLNASRGTVVNIPDLVEALKAGHLGGAYIDVFPTEPAGNSDGWVNPFEGCPNVNLTPHIGGSTVEAQAAIGDEVAAKMINYINAGKTMGAVNFPEINLPYGGPRTHRILNIHRNKPGVLKAHTFREINNILSVYNVESQILRTMETIGYLIADVDQNASDEIKSQIDTLPSTIKTRILY